MYFYTYMLESIYL